MPGQARRYLIEDGSICHIVQRGNNKQSIFRDKEDFRRFLSTVRRFLRKYAVDIYNYCLMINHIHLLLKTHKKEDLPKLMQCILHSYSRYYGQKYEYVGYLYQGRYRSEIIEDDVYLLECARYIERNPVRAGIVNDPKDYKWSSYDYYAYSYKSSILTENPTYSDFDTDIEKRRRLYREYVSIARPYEKIIDKEFEIDICA